MQIKTQEHTDVMSMFEKEHRGRRIDREPKTIWPIGRIYQVGQIIELFLAYRRGYALGKAIYQTQGEGGV